MVERINNHFMRADLANTDPEMTENILSDIGPCDYGDESEHIDQMVRRFIKAHGVMVQHKLVGDCWAVSNGKTSLRFRTRAQAYQFVLESIVNTGGLPLFSEDIYP